MPRLAIQDWRALPAYLPDCLWDRMMDKNEQLMSLVEGITNHLIHMGLRAPSEPTQALIAAIVIKRGSRPVDDPVYLRTCFVNVKIQVSSLLSKAKSDQKSLPGDYLLELPARVADAPEAVRQIAFPDGNHVQPRLDVPDLIDIARSIPLRSTNRKAGKAMEASSFADLF